MVTAKLDQSRVLVTEFHQNRSTLKGRSTGQGHTDTHTERDRQTRVKIRALQVCNRTKNELKTFSILVYLQCILHSAIEICSVIIRAHSSVS